MADVKITNKNYPMSTAALSKVHQVKFHKAHKISLSRFDDSE